MNHRNMTTHLINRNTINRCAVDAPMTRRRVASWSPCRIVRTLVIAMSLCGLMSAGSRAWRLPRRRSGRTSCSSFPTITPTRPSAPMAIRELIETPNIDRHGRGRDAVRPLPGAQFDLRPQPGHRAHRQVHPPERLLQQHEQPVRRLADDVSQAAAGGRLPDRHRSANGTGHRSDRLRLLAHPAGPGGLLQPADDPTTADKRQARGLHHRHHHRPVARLAQAARQVASRSC